MLGPYGYLQLTSLNCLGNVLKLVKMHNKATHDAFRSHIFKAELQKTIYS